jgi:hypothetical protein
MINPGPSYPPWRAAPIEVNEQFDTRFATLSSVHDQLIPCGALAPFCPIWARSTLSIQGSNDMPFPRKQGYMVALFMSL